MSEEPYDWSRGFELMLEEARRSIDSQRTAYQALRGRTSGVLTAAGAVAGVLVGLTDHHGLITWLGLVALIVLTGLSVLVLMPRQVTFDMNPADIRAYFTSGATSVNHMVDSVALAHWDNYLGNERLLQRLHDAYVWILVLFVVESGLMALDPVLH